MLMCCRLLIHQHRLSGLSSAAGAHTEKASYTNIESSDYYRPRIVSGAKIEEAHGCLSKVHVLMSNNVLQVYN